MAGLPNIVLFTSHDIGQHLGCYGQPTVRTPNLDAVAASGARFPNSFCTSPGCSPSRASLATGCYPHSVNVLGLTHRHYGWSLRPADWHIASLLKRAGYHTMLFGFQHVAARDTDLAFDEFHRGHTAASVAESVEKHHPTVRQPFYMEINFFEPHRPFGTGGVTPDTARGVSVPAYMPNTPDVRGEVAHMQGAITTMDAALGRILATINAFSPLDDTLVLYAADHGIPFPRAKGSLKDAGIETALLVRWPGGGIRRGIAPEPLISNVDILPTILDLIGLPVPAHVQGRSFKPLLHGGRYEERAEVFAEKTFHSEYNPLRAIRTKKHKLVAKLEVALNLMVPGDVMEGPTYLRMVDEARAPSGDPFLLFDLESDPLEKTNLAGRPEMAAVERDLKRRLWRWMIETKDPIVNGPVGSPFYERTLAALRES